MMTNISRYSNSGIDYARKPSTIKDVFAIFMSALLAATLLNMGTVAFFKPTPAYASDGSGTNELPDISNYLKDNLDSTIVEMPTPEPPSFASTVFSMITGNEPEPDDGMKPTGHMLSTVYTMADANLTQPNETMDSIYADPETAGQKIMAQYDGYTDVYDIGDPNYFVAFVDNTKMSGTGQVIDWAFTRRGTNGESIKNVIYDQEAGIVYIPKTLYFNEDGIEVVEHYVLQMLDLFSWDEDQTTELNVVVENKTNNVISPAQVQNVKQASLDLTINFPIATPETAVNVDPANLELYINGAELPVLLEEGEALSYNSETGELTINIPSTSIYKIKVVINEKPPTLVDQAYARFYQPDQMNAVYGKLVNLSVDNPNIYPSSIINYDGGLFYGTPSEAYPYTQHGWLYSWLNNSRYKEGLYTTQSLVDNIRDSRVTFGHLGEGLEQVPNSNYTIKNDINFSIAPPSEGVNFDKGMTQWDWAWERDRGLAPWIPLFCSHNEKYGSGNTNGNNRICMHILHESNGSTPYIVVGFTTPVVCRQSGCGVIKWITKPKETKGAIDFCKDSSNPALTGGVYNTPMKAGYDLNGAVYGIYRDPACTQLIEKHVTGEYCDESSAWPGGSHLGYWSTKRTFDAGTYYVKEISPPEGFEIDSRVYSVTVNPNDHCNRTGQNLYPNEPHPEMKETPKIINPPNITLEKRDADTGALLPGARFQFYRIDPEDPYNDTGNGVYEWLDVLTTDANGRIALNGEQWVEGYYRVKELSEPPGGYEYVDEYDVRKNAQFFKIGLQDNHKYDELFPSKGDTFFFAFYDKKKVSYGGLNLTKQFTGNPPSYSGQYSRAGCVFTIRIADTTRVDNGRVVATITTNSVGRASISPAQKLLEVGCRYSVTETACPAGWMIGNPMPYYFTLRNSGDIEQVPSGTFTNTARVFDLSLFKSVTNFNDQFVTDLRTYSIAGAQYGLYTNAACSGVPYQTFTITANGTSNTVRQLPAGIYYLKEITPPSSGYKLSSTVTTVDLRNFYGGAQQFTVSDEPIFADPFLTLIKVNAETKKAQQDLGDATLSAAVYRFDYYDEFFDTESAAGYTGTGASKAPTTKTPKLSFDVSTNAQGVLDSASIQSQLTAKGYNGHFPLGTVVLYEVSPPTGFLVQDDYYVFQVKQSGLSAITEWSAASQAKLASSAGITGAEGIDISKAVVAPESPKRIDIEFDKFYKETEEPDAAKLPLKNVKFGIYNISSKPVSRPDGTLAQPLPATAKDKGGDGIDYSDVALNWTDYADSLVIELTTDNDGHATTAGFFTDNNYYNGSVKGQSGIGRGALEYGKYVLVEYAMPDLTLSLIHPLPITVDETLVPGGTALEGYTFKTDLEDKPVWVEVEKVDADNTGIKDDSKVVDLEADSTHEMTFKVLDEDMTPMTWNIDGREVTELTTVNGRFLLPERLLNGTYYVQEIKSPSGYVLSPDPVKFVIPVNVGNDESTPINFALENQPQKAKIAITKYDSTKDNAIVTYDDPETEYKATFTIYADEDIITEDGTIRYRKDDPVCEIVAGNKGTPGVAESDEVLYATADGAKYYWKETKAPDGYVIDTEKHPFTVSYEDAARSDATHTHIVLQDKAMNSPQKGVLELTKGDEYGKDGLVGTEDDTSGLPIVYSAATFEIYTRHDIYDPCDHSVKTPANTLVATITTDNTGKAKTPPLDLGDYYIKETKAPTGYTINTDEIDVTVSYDPSNGQMIDISYAHQFLVNNKPQMGELIVEKHDSENGELVRGKTTQFKIFAVNDVLNPYDGTVRHHAGDDVLANLGIENAVITTDPETGQAKSPLLYPGRYRVVEYQAPEGYYNDNPQYNRKGDKIYNDTREWVVDIQYLDQRGNYLEPEEPHFTTSAGQEYDNLTTVSPAGASNADPIITYGHSFYNTPVKGQITVEKYDKETGVQIIRNGIEYEIYAREDIYDPTDPTRVKFAKDTMIEKIVSGKDGLAISSELYLGKYRVVESKAPYGYMRDDVSYDVDLEYNGQERALVYQTIRAMDTPQKVQIEIDKIDGDTNEAVKKAGIVFSIFAEEDILDPYTGDIKTHKGEWIQDITTGEDGIARSTQLPVGTYRIKETQAPYPYALDGEDVIIEQNYDSTETLITERKTISDSPQKGQIKVKKFDRNSYNQVARAGIEYEIYAVEDIKSPRDENEVVYPANTLVETIISREDGIATSQLLPLGKYRVVEKTPPTGYLGDAKPVEVEFKYAGQLSSIIEQTASLSDTAQKGRITAKKLDREQTELTGQEVVLSRLNTTFGIYAREDIVSSADGRIIYHAGDLVENITTDGTGTATSGLLEIGKYTVRETKAAEGYVNDSAPVDVDVIYQYPANDSAVIDYPTTFTDSIQKGIITSDKKDKETNQIVPNTGITFEIYADEDIKNPLDDSVVYPVDSLVDTMISDGDGIAHSKELYLGKYRIHEAKAPDGYVLDPDDKHVELLYGGQEEKLVFATDSIYDTAQKGIIEIQKTDADTKQYLSGAKFNIIADEDITTGDGTIRYKKGDIVDTVVTDKNGIARSKELYLGKYHFEEVENLITDYRDTNSIQLIESAEASAYIKGMGTKTLYIDEEILALNCARTPEQVKESLTAAGYDLFDIYTGRLVDAVPEIANQQPSEGKEFISDPNAIRTYYVVNGHGKGLSIPDDIDSAIAVRVNLSPEESTITRELSPALTKINGNNVGENQTVSAGDIVTYKLYPEFDVSASMFKRLNWRNVQGTPSSFSQGLMSVDNVTTQVPYDYNAANNTIKIGTGDNCAVYEVNFDVDEDEQHLNMYLDKKTPAELESGDYVIPQNQEPEQETDSDSDKTIEENQNSQELSASLPTLEDMPNTMAFKADITPELKVHVSMNVILNNVVEVEATDIKGNRIEPVDITDELNAIKQAKSDPELVYSPISTSNGKAYRIDYEFDDVSLDETTHNELTIAARIADGISDMHLINPNTLRNYGYILDKTKYPVELVYAGQEIPVTESTPVGVANKATEVHITKSDITGGGEVVGAYIEIKDKEGNVVDSWISTDEDHDIKGLKPDEDYTLKETVNPKEYEKSEEIEFHVNGDGTTDKVDMKDAPIQITGEIDKQQTIIREDGAYEYTIDYRSTSNTWADEFNVEDPLECVNAGLAKVMYVRTPVSFDDWDGKMNVWYKTNKTDPTYEEDANTYNALSTNPYNPQNPDNTRVKSYVGWKIWQTEVPTYQSMTLNVSDLRLELDEYVTGIRFEHGRVGVPFGTRENNNVLWNTARDQRYGEADNLDIVNIQYPEFFDLANSANRELAFTIENSVHNYAPAVIGMMTTDAAYADGGNKEIRNSANMDIYRNLGTEEEYYQILNDNDADQVVQLSPDRRNDVALDLIDITSLNIVPTEFNVGAINWDMITRGALAATGSVLPYVFGISTAILLSGLIIYIIRKRKNDRK